MVFEKISIVKGRKYKSLVEGYRDKEGIVRHRFIKYLGPVNSVNKKRRNPNAGRKPNLKIRELTEKERGFIQKNLKNSESFMKERARIIQHSSEDKTIRQICQKTGSHRPKVEKIIKQFNDRGLEIFQRGKSTGRPRRITKEERAKIIQFLNTKPEKLGLHFTNWSQRKLARYVKEQGMLVSHAQIGRIIKQDEIKYKKKTRWLYSNDPDFAKKN